MKGIKGVFATGLLVLVPLLGTIYILVWFVRWVDGKSRELFLISFLPFDFPGFGLLVSIGLAFIVGVIAQNYVGTLGVGLLDSLVRRIPLGGGLYVTIKKFLETIFNPRSDQFKGVVLIEFPRKGIHTIGFRTGTPDPKLTRKIDGNKVNVFVPCTPNPTSGFYLLVDESELTPLDMTVQEAFRVVISMGIVTSEELSAKR